MLSHRADISSDICLHSDLHAAHGHSLLRLWLVKLDLAPLSTISLFFLSSSHWDIDIKISTRGVCVGWGGGSDIIYSPLSLYSDDSPQRGWLVSGRVDSGMRNAFRVFSHEPCVWPFRMSMLLSHTGLLTASTFTASFLLSFFSSSLSHSLSLSLSGWVYIEIFYAWWIRVEFDQGTDGFVMGLFILTLGLAGILLLVSVVPDNLKFQICITQRMVACTDLPFL